jgi:hypothetical protein
MARRLAVTGMVIVFLVLTCIPNVDAGTNLIHVKTEDGGSIFNNNGTVLNEKGAIYWNGTDWMTADSAAHMYFVSSADNSIRLANYTTDLTIKGGETGTIRTGTMRIVFENVSYSINVSRYHYELTINGSAWTANAYQYEISTLGWKVVLQSRSDGTVNGTSYFHAFISQSAGNTAVLKEGVDLTKMSMGIDQALIASPVQASDYKLGGGANNNYWLDFSGGSDMGGLTYQLITDKVKMNGTVNENVISKFMVNYLNESTNGHKIAFEPSVQLTSSTGEPISGTNGNSPFDMIIMIVLIALVLMAVLVFVLVRRNRKQKKE